MCTAIVGFLAAGVPAAAGAPPASGTAASTSPNAVIVWDRNAQTAIWDVAGQQPQVQARSFAMVHGAVYDAVNAISGRPYEPYLSAPRTNGRESVNAAVGTAAFQVLSSLFPAQQARLQAQYDEWMATVPDSAAKRGGVSVGSQTAAAMIRARQDDGAFGDPAWPVGEPSPASGGRPRPPTPPTRRGWRSSSRSSCRVRRCSAAPARPR
ncbi:hypothetical protein [Parafrankia sp. EUN1f]|uniref:hypothetical protein n=1 Tax=Parafrankia sp. EUN1f TaxID=102897 RepID=UPI001E36EB6F|nr:hypothetical protein [Parafrankia sp. EUN1f]